MTVWSTVSGSSSKRYDLRPLNKVCTHLKQKVFMRPTDSFYKIHEAGFKIIRADDTPSPRIKEWKSHSVWVTMEKFESKAARDRRMQQLLREHHVVTL